MTIYRSESLTKGGENHVDVQHKIERLHLHLVRLRTINAIAVAIDRERPDEVTLRRCEKSVRSIIARSRDWTQTGKAA